MKHATGFLPFCFVVSLLSCLLLGGFASSVQAQKLGSTSPDYAALSALSNQMYDSAGTPGFFPLYERGLKEAIAQGNAQYEHTFRVGLLAHYQVLNQQDRYVAAADSLMRYYQERNNIDKIYRVWNLKISNIQSWGDYAGAVAANQQMADYAQKHNHPFGTAMANYYFARNYHNNGQTAEAFRYYHLAMSQFVALKMPGHVFSCGIDLMILTQSCKRDAEALALSDTLPPYIKASEQEKKLTVNPVFRMKLARLRLISFCALKDVPHATVERDTMLFYNNLYPDKNVQNSVQWALACYARLVGNHAEAKTLLTTLKTNYEQRQNYPQLAETLYFMAEVEAEQRNYAAATETFFQYKAANDSANLQASTEQLNRLTKQFRLNELEQEKRVVEAQLRETRTFAWSAGIIAVLFVLFCLSLLFYSRRLRQKNHALYLQYQKQKQAEVVLDKMVEQHATDDISDKEMQMFLKIRMLLKEKTLLADPLLDRNMLAEKLNTNYTYISKAVQTGAEMSVNRYISQVRVDYACELLRQKGHYTIIEVQELCGFQSSTSFNRAFKEVTQMTPTAFQKEATGK